MEDGDSGAKGRIKLARLNKSRRDGDRKPNEQLKQNKSVGPSRGTDINLISPFISISLHVLLSYLLIGDSVVRRFR